MVLTRTPALLATLALGAGLCACSGLTPGNAFDRPLFAFGGAFIANSALPADSTPLLAVLWTDPLQRQPDVLMPPSWISASIEPGVDGGQETVQAQVFRPPPPDAMVEIAAPAGGDTTRLALGEIVIADDADHDGTIQVDGPAAAIAPAAAESAARDSYIAGAVQVLLYVERPFSPTQTSFPLAFSAGYHLVDFQCTGKTSMGAEESPGVTFVAQTSQGLPEIRDCMRTHAF